MKEMLNLEVKILLCFDVLKFSQNKFQFKSQ